MEWAYNINPTELKLIFFFTPFGAVLRNYQNGASDVRYHRIYLYWWYAIYTDRTIYSSAFHLKKKAQNIYVSYNLTLNHRANEIRVVSPQRRNWIVFTHWNYFATLPKLIESKWIEAKLGPTLAHNFNYDSLAFISKAPNKVAAQIECQYDWFNSEYKLEKKNEREKNRKRNSFPIIWLNCTQNCIWKAAGSKQTFFKSTTFFFLARSQTSRHTHTSYITLHHMFRNYSCWIKFALYIRRKKNLLLLYPQRIIFPSISFICTAMMIDELIQRDSQNPVV